MSARAGFSLSMNNCPDTCDSLHVTNVVSIATIFIRGLSYLTLHIYLVACHYYGHVHGSYTEINFNELLWNCEFTIKMSGSESRPRKVELASDHKKCDDYREYFTHNNEACKNPYKTTLPHLYIH